MWFPLRKALKNYTKSFGIKIINKNDPLIQLNSTTDSVASLLKKQLNEMKGTRRHQIRLEIEKMVFGQQENI